METIRYCAPCLFGAEGILRDELRRMDARGGFRPNRAGLFFRGQEMMARPTSAAGRRNGCRC